MIRHARQHGIGFAGVGFDGFYGRDHGLLRALDADGERLVGDVHKNQRIDLTDPEPVVPPPTASRGRPPSALQAQPPALRVDSWAPQQPPGAWQRVTLRDGTQGPLQVDILHRRVWW